jgi:uncharacterized protein (DUF1697 family)
MSTYISMLRGINVSGQNRIRMEDLKKLYTALRLVNVSTYVQSGNVVFESEERSPTSLAKQIEAQLSQSFNISVPVLVRAPQDFRRILLSNPFLRLPDADLTSLHVSFLSGYPSTDKLGNLICPGDGDEFSIGEQEIFLLCPNGYSRTKLNNAFFEKKLGLIATTRNWKTVNALYELATRI